ncbi:MAG TPA: hypothetical protein DCG75_05815 [Bacteroidales bacterium]|jgi:hypothetical protein|nr:hypothetical protein [Bacteroidales bacterium]
MKCEKKDKDIRFKLLIFSILFTACSVYESGYQDSALTIDGSSSDWNTTLESKSTGISYGISNDSENLYVRLNITDQDIQQKILLAGLTIWLDTTGKRKEVLGITCPKQKIPSKMDRNSIQNMHKNPEFEKNQILEGEFVGFNEYYETFYMYSNPYGIRISIDQDEFKSMCYEMKIPFASIYKDFKNISSKSISIGFETGSIDQPIPANLQSSNSPDGKGMGNAPPGGMSGENSGRMGSGKPSGIGGVMPNQSLMTNISTPIKFWIKNIQLAQP